MEVVNSIPSRATNVEDSLKDMSALAVLGVGLLHPILMLGTLLVTYKIPGHERVKYTPSILKLDL